MRKKNLFALVSRRIIDLLIAFAICPINFSYAITAFAEEVDTQSESGSYVDDYAECSHELIFAHPTDDGQSMYSYNLLYDYDYTQSDFDELGTLFQSPENVDAIHVQKYDCNADGIVSVVDYVELAKHIQVEPEGFDFDYQHYDYNLVRRSTITQDQIDYVKMILAKFVKPAGPDISKFDYNLNGRIDIGDVVLMNQYFSRNPCRFLHDTYGKEIKPDVLKALIDTAMEMGCNNFIIMDDGGIDIPYSIQTTCSNFMKGEVENYSIKALQSIPNDDKTFENSNIYPIEYKDEMSLESQISFWIDLGLDPIVHQFWGYDEYGNVVWINKCIGKSANNTFALIPLDENGQYLNRCLYQQ